MSMSNSSPTEDADAARQAPSRLYRLRAAMYSRYTCNSSSTATMSNLPGAGRTMGRVFSKAGLVLEKGLGRAAHGLGYSPDAIAKRILSDKLSDEKKEREYERLVQFIRSPIASTKIRALELITEISEHPSESLFGLFTIPDLVEIISNVVDLSFEQGHSYEDIDRMATISEFLLLRLEIQTLSDQISTEEDAESARRLLELCQATSICPSARIYALTQIAKLWKNRKTRDVFPITETIDVITKLPDKCAVNGYSEHDLQQVRFLVLNELSSQWHSEVRWLSRQEGNYLQRLMDYCRCADPRSQIMALSVVSGFLSEYDMPKIIPRADEPQLADTLRELPDLCATRAYTERDRRTIVSLSTGALQLLELNESTLLFLHCEESIRYFRYADRNIDKLELALGLLALCSQPSTRFTAVRRLSRLLLALKAPSIVRFSLSLATIKAVYARLYSSVLAALSQMIGDEYNSPPPDSDSEGVDILLSSMLCLFASHSRLALRPPAELVRETLLRLHRAHARLAFPISSALAARDWSRVLRSLSNGLVVPENATLCSEMNARGVMSSIPDENTLIRAGYPLSTVVYVQRLFWALGPTSANGIGLPRGVGGEEIPLRAE